MIVAIHPPKRSQPVFFVLENLIKFEIKVIKADNFYHNEDRFSFFYQSIAGEDELSLDGIPLGRHVADGIMYAKRLDLPSIVIDDRFEENFTRLFNHIANLA